MALINIEQIGRVRYDIGAGDDLHEFGQRVHGDDIDILFSFENEDGTPAADFTGFTGTSEIRDEAGALLDTATVGFPANHQILWSVDETLAIAALGKNFTDIKIVNGATTKHIIGGRCVLVKERTV